MVLDEKAKDFLVEKGYDPTYGARPMRRPSSAFSKTVWPRNPQRQPHEGEPIQVTVEEGNLHFVQNVPPAGALSS